MTRNTKHTGQCEHMLKGACAACHKPFLVANKRGEISTVPAKLLTAEDLQAIKGVLFPRGN